MNDPDTAAETTRKHTYGTWRKQKGWTPLNIVAAEGSYFTDANGKRYLDLSSQLVCSNLGHGNRAVLDAVTQQLATIPYLNPSFTCEARVNSTKALLEVMPPGLDKFFFSTSGTEANEAAFKIARAFTGKRKILSRYLSYHGSTAGSIAATGDYRRWYVDGTGKADGFIFGPDAYCYRCPVGKTYPDCGIACAEYLEYMIERENDVAAVIVEPIVGTNGVVVPPPEYLPRVREITRKHGVLLIADEVMTGWGRTGEWFCVNHWGVTPDILTTAKGSTGAYVPLGITATSHEIAEYFEEHYFPHGHTYEAHPVTLSAVPAAIAEYKRLDLMHRSQEMGTYLGKRLRELQERHPSVGDVRGLGLFWGVELTRDPKTRAPFNTMREKFEGKPLVIDKVAAYAMQNGIYVMGVVNHLVVAPPLVITREELDAGLEVLDKALEIPDGLVGHLTG